MSLTVVRFDTSPRSTIERGLLVHQIIRGHTLYNDGYKLAPARRRGRASVALYAEKPGEGEVREYRPILRGRQALHFALAIGAEQAWSLDSERIHDFWVEEGEYVPDFGIDRNPWDWGL